MREIKFRAWDKKNKSLPVVLCLEDFWHDVEKDPERYEVMQYTGLKDKNGKEIYEGDILEIEQNEGIEDFPNWVKHKEPVIFSQGAFHSIFGYSVGELFEMEYKPEVIGNIYENPLLIKKDK